jgi:hypothetical protein
MKNLIVIFFSITTLFATAQKVVTNLPQAESVSGTDAIIILQQGESKLTTLSEVSARSNGYVIAADYGFSSGNTPSQNRTALNSAQEAALSAATTMYLGAGVFQLDSFSWNPNIALQGAGKTATTLRSTIAVPLIKRKAGVTGEGGGQQIYPVYLADMTLDGDSIGTIGLDITQISQFDFWRLYIKNFTSRGISTAGVLQGSWYSCWWRNCNIGYKSIYNDVQSNLVRFNDCFFYENDSLAVDYDGAEGIQFNSTNFELNGTTGDSGTGGVKLSNMNTGGGVVVSIFDRCWLERNKGGFGIWFDTPANAAHSIFQNGSNFFNSDLTNAIKVSSNHHLVVFGSKVGDAAGAGILTDGANAKTFVEFSAILAHSEANGGTYDVIH